MRGFLSYASEDRELADQIQLALVGGGHQVFFDQQSLPPGGDYLSRIRSGVERSNFFIFLISPESVARGSFALTELKCARAKWAHPKDHVLPVVVRSVPWETIPTYLRAVTVLEPEGNIPAEVLIALTAMMHSVPESQDSNLETKPRTTAIPETTPSERTLKVKVLIAVAILGICVAIAAAIVGNWDKIFSSGSPSARPGPPINGPPALPPSPPPVPEPTGERARFNVTVEPDTVAIKVGTYSVVSYRFREVAGVGATVESQDVRWVLPNGAELSAEKGNRILGGSFSVGARGTHELHDNVYLPFAIVNAALQRGQNQVQLETTFAATDFNEKSVRAKAILRIHILASR